MAVTRSLIIALTVTAGLSGCVTTPTALLGPALSAAWDMATGDEEISAPDMEESGTLSVHEMLANLRGDDSVAAIPAANDRGSVELTWRAGQESLNIAQKAKLFTLLSRLPENGVYQITIRTSPTSDANPLLSLQNGLERARITAAAATDARFTSDIVYEPGMAPDRMIIDVAPATAEGQGGNGA